MNPKQSMGFALLSLCLLASCGEYEEEGTGGSKYSYRFSSAECDTGEHVFRSKKDYCLGLQDHSRNQNCAEFRRELEFKSSCSETWIRSERAMSRQNARIETFPANLICETRFNADSKNPSSKEQKIQIQTRDGDLSILEVGPDPVGGGETARPLFSRKVACGVLLASDTAELRCETEVRPNRLTQSFQELQLNCEALDPVDVVGVARPFGSGRLIYRSSTRTGVLTCSAPEGKSRSYRLAGCQEGVSVPI